MREKRKEQELLSFSFRIFLYFSLPLPPPSALTRSRLALLPRGVKSARVWLQGDEAGRICPHEVKVESAVVPEVRIAPPQASNRSVPFGAGVQRRRIAQDGAWIRRYQLGRVIVGVCDGQRQRNGRAKRRETRVDRHYFEVKVVVCFSVNVARGFQITHQRHLEHGVRHVGLQKVKRKRRCALIQILRILVFVRGDGLSFEPCSAELKSTGSTDEPQRLVPRPVIKLLKSTVSTLFISVSSTKS